MKFDFSTLHSTQPRFTLVFREPTFISTRGEFNPELSTSDSHCTRCNPGRIFCNPCAHAHTQITNPACAMHRKRGRCGARAAERPASLQRVRDVNMAPPSSVPFESLFLLLFYMHLRRCRSRENESRQHWNMLQTRRQIRDVPTKAAPGLFACTCTIVHIQCHVHVNPHVSTQAQ